MRINDSNGQKLSAVYLGLSETEADELIQALTELRGAAEGWHQHVSDASYSTEISVYREDDETSAFHHG